MPDREGNRTIPSVVAYLPSGVSVCGQYAPCFCNGSAPAPLLRAGRTVRNEAQRRFRLFLAFTLQARFLWATRRQSGCRRTPFPHSIPSSASSWASLRVSASLPSVSPFLDFHHAARPPAFFSLPTRCIARWTRTHTPERAASPAAHPRSLFTPPDHLSTWLFPLFRQGRKYEEVVNDVARFPFRGAPAQQKHTNHVSPPHCRGSPRAPPAHPVYAGGAAADLALT